MTGSGSRQKACSSSLSITRSLSYSCQVPRGEISFTGNDTESKGPHPQDTSFLSWEGLFTHIPILVSESMRAEAFFQRRQQAPNIFCEWKHAHRLMLCRLSEWRDSDMHRTHLVGMLCSKTLAFRCKWDLGGYLSLNGCWLAVVMKSDHAKLESFQMTCRIGRCFLVIGSSFDGEPGSCSRT